MSKAPPPKASPPTRPAPPVSKPVANGSFAISSGIRTGPQRIGIYGTAGIGKTSLVASLVDVGRKPLLVDLDQGSGHLQVDRIDTIETWDQFVACLNDNQTWAPYDVVVIDSMSKAQELCMDWIPKNVKTESGAFVQRIEHYGYGKGYMHIFEEMNRALAILDRHMRAGRDVVLVMHADAATVPNPAGDDYLQHAPRLMEYGKTAKVRSRVVEWLDYLLFVGYDIAVTEKGVARGGSRTIYTEEFPWLLAKRRKALQPQYRYDLGDTQIWSDIFAKD